MGRIFETRKHVMFARWDRMAKAFARIGKEIAIAVKAGGPNPEFNPLLRRVLQNARAVNMPKDKVESAIKKASGQGAVDYEEVLYEGYAPHGVAVLIETATDNTSRTVPNLRTHFNKGGGNLGNTGSVAFQFKRMGVFRLHPEGIDPDDARARADRPRPRGDGRVGERQGRAAARHPLRLQRLRHAAEGARRARDRADLGGVGVHPAHHGRAVREGERTKSSSSSTSSSRTTTSSASSTTWSDSGLATVASQLRQQVGAPERVRDRRAKEAEVPDLGARRARPGRSASCVRGAPV